ncbi:MAG: hypothetical protein KatS3mg082_1976 [Nitrospiraceae bacterium]|nr:MAG: hypothetical protein KatS3mg082_1976 [Nitrospiraceae bacterium]
MALWYAEHSDFVFRVVYGDKECFHLAWRFWAPSTPCRQGPRLERHTIVQYDFEGQDRLPAPLPGQVAVREATAATPRWPTKTSAFSLIADLTHEALGLASSGTIPTRRWPRSSEVSTSLP